MTFSAQELADFHVIADHLRTSIFAIADGALPEAKGRGYVLRKLIKRALLKAFFNGIREGDLERVVEVIIQDNSTYYKKLEQKKELIINELRKEISKQSQAIRWAEKKLKELKNLEAETLFLCYDSWGVPIEMIRHFVESRKTAFPEEKFQQLLEKQKRQSQEERKSKNIKVF